MNISILMLTHNRPHLFQRALNSVLKTNVMNLEILVNNDSCDIEETNSNSHDVKYFYNKHDDITKIYRFLFESTTRDFVYFLEDDDYINRKFFDYIDLNCDINFMNYISTPLVSEVGLQRAVLLTSQNTNKETPVLYEDFIQTFAPRYFQLGQLLFRKSKLAEFPYSKNCIQNDLMMFNNFKHDSVVNYIDTPLWVQTTDGKDNISFDNLSGNNTYYCEY